MFNTQRLSAMTVLSCVVLTVGAGCKSATEPPIPADWFTFDVSNRINQSGPDTTAAQQVMELFQVHLATGTSMAKMAEIQKMEVVWPDGALRTSVPDKFQSESGVYDATGVEQRPEGLMAGTYTLEVEFKDGQTVRRRVDYDGHVLGRPVVQSVTPSADGVQIIWDAPMLKHTWRLFLTQDTAQIAVSSPHATTGGTVTGSIEHPLSSGTYVLELLMYDDFNQRMVLIPFDYTAP